MSLRLVFTDAAEQDLVGVFNYLAVAASVDVASGYVARLTALCEALAASPERGMRRDDIRPGVRSYGWRRRASIVFSVLNEEVLIIGIFVNGRDIESGLVDRDFGA